MLSPRPIHPNPHPNLVRLYNLLRRTYGKKIISGQCDDKYLDFIKRTSGGFEPALMGYDFNGLMPSQRGNRDVEKAIAWHRRGGIVTFQWHWISPDANGDFYTDNFRLADALACPTGPSYNNMIRDIDLVGEALARLRDAGVPVLWRPLHEAEGRWFWWGKSGGTACRELYHLMYDRFTNRHGLNNLLWVWTSYGRDHGNWHPGEDVVDLIVRDYESPTSWRDFQEMFGAQGKMFGLGEEGRLPDPADFPARPWLYFMTWAYMIEEPQRGNTPEWIRHVYSSPTVLTLRDLVGEAARG
ncbi:MAG: glycoside hydrolase family 26 protein [Fimbriimonadaceae bacterium]|nr:glycoside hydrolase family 26 protein [Fimbriimonadaceae bacterium]